MKKNLKILIGVVACCLLFCLGYGLYQVADRLVFNSYSSGEVVLENVPTSSPIPSESAEGKVVGSSTDSGIEGEIIPEKLYEDEGLILRSREYLGQEYFTYEQLFKDIVAMGDDPYESLDPKNNSYMVTVDQLNTGIMMDSGVYETTVLDDYDVIDMGLYGGIDPQGAVAVFCYDGTRVIYKLDTEKPSFFVVDYSQNVFSEDADMVEFGGIVGMSLWFVRERCNKMQIDGYDVYFSYAQDVMMEWEQPGYIL